MKQCSNPGCSNPISGKGLCKKHYDALPENKEKARLREKAPHRQQQRKNARSDPEWKAYQKNWFLTKKYGITLEDFTELYSKQNGCCAICKNKLTKPHVDHNHETGKVRGLLCKPCNQGIGFLRDSIEILNNAINYISSNHED
jgi:hypothetical protein